MPKVIFSISLYNEGFPSYSLACDDSKILLVTLRHHGYYRYLTMNNVPYYCFVTRTRKLYWFRFRNTGLQSAGNQMLTGIQWASQHDCNGMIDIWKYITTKTISKFKMAFAESLLIWVFLCNTNICMYWMLIRIWIRYNFISLTEMIKKLWGIVLGYPQWDCLYPSINSFIISTYCVKPIVATIQSLFQENVTFVGVRHSLSCFIRWTA